MSEADDLYDDFINEFALLVGNGTYDIRRPNYANPATPEYYSSSKVDMRCDLQRSPYQEPQLPHIEYYSVFCNRDLLKVGDVIIPNPGKEGVPAITIQNVDNIKECIGFRTDRKGKLSASDTEPLFDNVRFEFGGPVEALAPINDIASSPNLAQQRAYMYYRPSLRIGNYLYDYATDSTWEIKQISFVGSTMILDINQRV